uniref:Uncharacterized protein n=1 Tax=Timema genevievae TaxID=629358 RepID=A0A7R9PGL8_TIMGE|nr:unnamed protein product [Timema genevievae]
MVAQANFSQNATRCSARQRVRAIRAAVEVTKTRENELVEWDGGLANALVVLSPTAEDGEIEDLGASRVCDRTSFHSLLCGQFLRGDCDWRPECASSVSTLRLRQHCFGNTAPLANALVVLSPTAEDGEIEVRISVG